MKRCAPYPLNRTMPLILLVATFHPSVQLVCMNCMYICTPTKSALSFSLSLSSFLYGWQRCSISKHEQHVRTSTLLSAISTFLRKSLTGFTNFQERKRSQSSQQFLHQPRVLGSRFQQSSQQVKFTVLRLFMSWDEDELQPLREISRLRPFSCGWVWGLS